MDHLSVLPKHILDDILSRLPEEDAARTSVLSKAMNETWSTSPILRFSVNKHVFGVRGDSFLRKEMMLGLDLEWKTNKFLEQVEKTLTRFHNQGLAIREFKLHMQNFASQSIYPLFDRWMRMSLEGGVQVLDLLLPHNKVPLRHQYYCLPTSIFDAQSLIKLKLDSVKVDHSSVNDSIQFSSLQELILSHVTLGDEQTIQNIISSCPLIEYLSLNSCRLEGQNDFCLKSVRINGPSKLKKVVASQVQEIDIDAPNLEDLFYYPPCYTDPSKINLDKSKNLKKLHLSQLSINDEWLLELFLKFSLLERLELPMCKFSKKIKISSAHLKVLELTNCCDSNLKELIIDAPNLRSLRFHTYLEIPTLSFLSSSSLLQADVTIIFSMSCWKLKMLRQFLQSFEHGSINLASLSLEIRWQNLEFLNIHELRDASVPPPRIKHLNLRINPKLHHGFLLLVTCILCHCLPTTISVRHDSASDSLVEAICTVLNVKTNECYCGFRNIKCWWHYLKSVQVTRTVEEATIQLEH